MRDEGWIGTSGLTCALIAVEINQLSGGNIVLSLAIGPVTESGHRGRDRSGDRRHHLHHAQGWAPEQAKKDAKRDQE